MTRTKFPVKKTPVKNLGGRPTKFKKSYYRTAYISYSMGATDKQFIDFINITVATLDVWKKKYVGFKCTIDKAKLYYDNKAVVSRLLQRALGYDYEEEINETNPRGEIKRVIKKQKAPDVDAIKCWLSNRHRKEWKYLGYGPKEIKGDFTNKSESTVNHKINLKTDIKDEQLASAIGILIKSGAIKLGDEGSIPSQIH
jgi:hypothetical protein